MIKNSQKYKEYFDERYLMGPNNTRLLDELLMKYPLQMSRENKILDLGCGTGLSSIFIANETGATIYANDLWVSKEDNEKRFTALHMENQIIPSREDANQLSFGKDMFDALISVDSYHYFAGKEKFFEERILPFVKKGGTILIAIPGVKDAYEGQQENLLKEWIGDEFYMFHSCKWWENILGDSDDIEVKKTWEMENFEIAWDEWLATKNEYAMGDKVCYESIIKKYTNFVGIMVKKA